jgi:predicted glycoside hydrolase/deacetylase ChbG (UPF0249 family)
MSALAQRLGFAAGDRIAIVHCDDIGMCHAANQGAFEALARGPATCGSAMVPCPWFAEAAALARERPGVDLGVHLTLNCEYRGYRWGPVLGASAVPSLVLADGGFPMASRDVAARAREDEVERELRAQIERALDAGVDVTHLDAHMGTALLPRFIGVYAGLAVEFRLPVFAVGAGSGALARLPAEASARYDAALAVLAAAGIPLLDAYDANSLHFAPGQGEAHNRERLRKLPPGVSYLICHPACAGEELGAITADAHMRDFERGFYGGDAGRRALEREGIRTAGMRALRDLVRSGGGPPSLAFGSLRARLRRAC